MKQSILVISQLIVMKIKGNNKMGNKIHQYWQQCCINCKKDKIKMSQVNNWHHVIKNVQNANLDQQLIQKNIRGLNKRAYRQQLDREVQIKNYEVMMKNQMKRRQLHQAKYLAEVEQQTKLQQRQISKQKQRHYGEQNEHLIRVQNSIKSKSKQIQRKHVKNFLQHPFVKLVDNQDHRIQHLRTKFIKQNQINHLQQQMRNQQRQANRYKEMQQKNHFIDHVEETHQKRSADREKFKNKYLRIKKPELDEALNQNIKPELSVEKMYVSYLNNQIKSNHEKKVKEKAQLFDDKRIQDFYISGQVEPDSSPAYLGRNPMTYDRKRQLYFINKHLNIHHQRSVTSNSRLNSKTEFIPNLIGQNQHTKSGHYLKLASHHNPEQQRVNISKHIDKQNSNPFHNHSQSSNFRPYQNNQTITERQRQRSYQNSPQIYSTIKPHHKSVLDNSRRIKSELVEGAYESYNQQQKLPTISKKLLPPQRQNNSIDSSNITKKRYFRYDVISGKQTPFYA